MTEPVEDGLDFAYDSYLGQVPETLRGEIEPLFKKYSEDLQGKVTSQLGDLQPYREIVDQGWKPEHVTTGLDLLQQLNTNPKSVIEAIAQEYPELLNQITTPPPAQIPGQTPGQQQQTSSFTPGDMDISPALQQRLDQQEQLINLMFQGFQNQQQMTEQQQNAAREQQEMAQFNIELDKIAPGDKYHRPFILSYIAQGATPQQAVQQYTEWHTAEQQRMRGSAAPLVAPGSGGGLPSDPVDTSKLNDTDRKALITKYLEAANQQT